MNTMYQQPSAQWAPYYAEFQPQKRKEILKENLLNLEDDGTFAFRDQLFEERHQDPKDSSRLVDVYLWKFAYLPGLFKKRNAFLFSQGFQREVQQTLVEFHLSELAELTEGEKGVLYLEFRNAAKRYLSTCRSDRYGRKLLGTKSSSMDEKVELACSDIWSMSRGIALASGFEREMELFCDALRDELMCYEPQCREIYEKLETQGQSVAAEQAKRKKKNK